MTQKTLQHYLQQVDDAFQNAILPVIRELSSDPVLSPYVSWQEEYFRDNRYRNAHFLKLMDEVLKPGMDVVEVGAAPFHLTWILKHTYQVNIRALDLLPEPAVKFVQKLGLEVLSCDIEREDIPLEDASVDVILFAEVLEHLRWNPLRAFREFHRILRDEGILVLTTPNLYSARRILRYFLGRGVSDGGVIQEFEKVERSGFVGHVSTYCRKDVRDFLEYGGFQPIRWKFQAYQPDKPWWLRLFYRVFPGFRPSMIVIAQKVSPSSRKA